ANGIIDKILDVSSIRGATLVPDGPLTRRTVKLLNANDNTVAIAAADLSVTEAQGSSESGIDTAPRRLSPQVVVAPFDPAVGAALAGAGTTPEVPTYLDSSLTVRLGHDSVTARRQDALGSIFWHALDRDEPRTQILVPPSTWNLQADDAQVILTALTTTIRSGLAVPRPLPVVVADANQAAQASTEEVGAYASAPGQFTDDVTAG